MEQEFGFKELYDVFIKATYPIEINGKTFVENETIANFDKIQLANFNEETSFVSANGGFDNRARVWWERTKDVKLEFTQGIFSRTQFALLNNLKVLKKAENVPIYVPVRETCESTEEGDVVFSHIPCEPLFVYNVNTGAAITDYTVVNDHTINITAAYTSVLLDYLYEYTNGSSTFIVGSQLTNGTFVLIGKTKVKDDITGQVKTGIIRIPKLKLMSDLSMRLGTQANPVVGRMSAMAIPVGDRGRQYVMEMEILNDDIDSDM